MSVAEHAPVGTTLSVSLSSAVSLSQVLVSGTCQTHPVSTAMTVSPARPGTRHVFRGSTAAAACASELIHRQAVISREQPLIQPHPRQQHRLVIPAAATQLTVMAFTIGPPATTPLYPLAIHNRADVIDPVRYESDGPIQKRELCAARVCARKTVIPRTRVNAVELPFPVPQRGMLRVITSGPGLS